MIDENLVAQAKRGDKDALLDLIMARRNEYYRLAMIHIGSPDDAMDAIQEMTLIVYNQIPRLKNPSAFYSWSMTILINCCRKIERQRRRMVWIGESYEYGKSELAAEQNIDLIQALDRLKPNHREAVILKYLMDMDYETMAQILQIPVGTAKTRVYHGLRQLKALLSEGGEVYGQG